MRLAAPTMASTGHAWMHLVQPMQISSSMIATSCAAGWALIDVRVAARYRVGIRPARRIAAARALRLREQCIDARGSRMGRHVGGPVQCRRRTCRRSLAKRTSWRSKRTANAMSNAFDAPGDE